MTFANADRVTERVHLSLLIAAWLSTGCGFVGANSLPTDPTWQGGCSLGVGRDATLHGSASDPRLAWAIDHSGGDRVELLWPAGYTARFNPQLVVLDGRGEVVAHEGDLIIGSCLPRPEDGEALRVDAAEVRPPTWQPGDG